MLVRINSPRDPKKEETPISNGSGEKEKKKKTAAFN